MLPTLGRLTSIKVGEVWANEPHVFTPWLAQNLDLLADALEIEELDLKGQEVPAGEFRIDILAEDSAGDLVIIENQFGATDHRHLGQLISYVASLARPATLVWIAERIREDHRAAIDWLNSSTSEDYSFFAVELAALRIGDSVPAPSFSVVAKPNNWSRTISEAAKEAQSGQLAERHKHRIAYWTSFASYLKQHEPSFRIGKPGKDHWREFPLGRSGFVISCTITMSKQRIGVELYIHNDPSKAAYSALLNERPAIEQQFGHALDWQQLEGKKASRVALFLNNVDAADQSQYPKLHQWMLERMLLFRAVFAERVRNLKSDTSQAAADEDDDL